MMTAADISAGRDVTIIGAGIVGLCTALSLQDKGFDVTLIDRAAPGQVTSFGNAGIISPWSVVPQSAPGLWKKIPAWLLDPLGPVTIRPGHLPRMAGWGLRFLAAGREGRVREISRAMDVLNRDCVGLYRQHLAGTGDEHLVQDCYYVHAFRNPADARLDQLDYQMRHDAGAPMERIGAEALQTLEPAISREFKAAIIIRDQARALSPGGIGTALARKITRAGGVFHCETVQSLTPSNDGNWQVQTDQQTRFAGQVVVAAGAWSAQLLKPLGVRIPLQAERGYHISFTNPGIRINHSVMDMDMKFAASTMQDGLRVAGTAEFAGLDAPENPKRLAALKQMASGMFPGLLDDTCTTWSGQRPSLPDSLPCISPVSGLPGLTLAFGHGHCGLMMAPKTGRIAADIVAGTPTNIDLTPFSAGRF